MGFFLIWTLTSAVAATTCRSCLEQNVYVHVYVIKGSFYSVAVYILFKATMYVRSETRDVLYYVY